MDKDEHSALNDAQLNEDRDYLEDLAYFSGIDPADIVDTSSEHPWNSGNPKTAESAFEQVQIEERAAQDFEQEQDDLDADKQE